MLPESYSINKILGINLEWKIWMLTTFQIVKELIKNIRDYQIELELELETGIPSS